jgi:drug/metabolite transporter (DMT)-like permease
MLSFYLFMVAGFLYVKPSVAFDRNGSIRPFGTKKKDSTVFPVWWWMFIFAVFSYLGVAYLTNYSF